MKEPYTFNASATEWATTDQFPDIRLTALQTYEDCPTSRITLVELKVGGEIDTHRNEGENESAYILEGRGKLTVGDKDVILEAGQGITIPGELPHSMVNVGDVPIKLIAVHTKKE